MEEEKKVNEETFEEELEDSYDEAYDDFEDEEEPDIENDFSLKPVAIAVGSIATAVVGITLAVKHFVKKRKEKEIVEPDDEEFVEAEYRECEDKTPKSDDEKTEADED